VPEFPKSPLLSILAHLVNRVYRALSQKSDLSAKGAQFENIGSAEGAEYESQGQA